MMKAFSLRACGRILWREGAEQYAFCIGVFALLLVLQASWMTMETFRMAPQPTTAYGFGLALFMTAVYAAASSALLLTAEVDAGTFVFQRTKPIGWFTYLWGKLSWVALSCTLFGLVAWLETCAWLGVIPDARDASFAFGVSGVGVLEGIAWGLLASMSFREPLRAVVAGIAMASVATWVTVGIHHNLAGRGTIAVTTAYYEGAGLRVIVAGVVLTIAILRGRSWFRTGQPLRLLTLPGFQRAETVSVAVPGEWDAHEEPWRGRSIRLLWQAWRQLRTAALVYWTLCLVACIWAGSYYLYKSPDPLRPTGATVATTLGILSFSVVGLSSLLAGYTFGADQKARFLQLARDGVSPWEIWLSRLAVTAAVLLPSAVLVLVSFWVTMEYEEATTLFRPLLIFVVAIGYVSVVVIGQACSMYVRSRIIALIAAPVVAACFAFWFVLSLFWAGLDWKLAVAPLLIALLIGTRLLAGTRLRQDHSWRAMRVPALLVVAAVVVTYQALAYHRTHEIRPYDSRVHVDHEFMGVVSKEVVQSFLLLDSASASGRSSARQELERMLSGDRNEAQSLQPDQLRNLWGTKSQVAFVQSYSDMLREDAAANRWLREMVSKEDVPHERLRSCIELLENRGRQRARYAQWLAADYQRDMYWLYYGPIKISTEYGFHGEPLLWRYRWLPFERIRAHQLLDRAYRIAAERSEEHELAVINDRLGHSEARNQRFGTGFGGSALLTSPDLIPPDPARSVWYQMANQRLLEGPSLHHFQLIEELRYRRWGGEALDFWLYTAESQRRGTILYLALLLYYQDHGELPESLEGLVEARYLTWLPIVPFACKPFYYSRARDERELDVMTDLSSVYQHHRTFQPASVDANELIGHDAERPFLWYPIVPEELMDPAVAPGFFIDLDFVE